MNVPGLLSQLRSELQRIEQEILVLERLDAGVQSKQGSAPYRLHLNWTEFNKRMQQLADGGDPMHLLE